MNRYLLPLALAAVTLCCLLLPRDAHAAQSVALASTGTEPQPWQGAYVETALEGGYLDAAHISATYAGAYQFPALSSPTVAGVDAWAHAWLSPDTRWLISVSGSIDGHVGYHVRGALAYAVVGWSWSVPTWTGAAGHELVELLLDGFEGADGCERVVTPATAEGWIFPAYQAGPGEECVTWSG